MIGFFTGRALVEGEGSTEAVGARPGPVLVEAVSSPPSSDSDSVSVRSRGCFMISAASMKLKGSTSVPFAKKGDQQGEEFSCIRPSQGDGKMLQSLLSECSCLPPAQQQAKRGGGTKKKGGNKRGTHLHGQLKCYQWITGKS